MTVSDPALVLIARSLKYQACSAAIRHEAALLPWMYSGTPAESKYTNNERNIAEQLHLAIVQ